MEIWNELLLSCIAIVLGLLISMIASAAADRGRDRRAKIAEERSVELEDLGMRREGLGTVGDDDQVVGSSGSSGADAELREEEERSGVVDVDGERLFEFMPQEEKRLEAEEFVEEFDRDDAELSRFVLREVERRGDERSQVVDLVIDDSVKEFGEPVDVGEDGAEDVQERVQLPDTSSPIHEDGNEGESGRVEESCICEEGGSLVYSEDDEPVRIGEIVANMVQIRSLIHEDESKGEIRRGFESSICEKEGPLVCGEDDDAVTIDEVNTESTVTSEVDGEMAEVGLSIHENVCKDETGREKESGRCGKEVTLLSEEDNELAKICAVDAEMVRLGQSDNVDGNKGEIRTGGESSICEQEGSFLHGKDDEQVKIDEADAEMIQIGQSIHEDVCKGEIGSGEKSGICEEEGTLLPGEDAEPIIIGQVDADLVHVDGYLREIESGEENSNREKEGTLLCGEDEWEGIEKSEVEKLFGVALEYVETEDGGNALSRLNSDVQKQLYGLHKVATEGPCYDPQPLALKVTARAKWHSWQSLGKMTPEVAMEQYIALLSESIPGWMGKHGRKGNDTVGGGTSKIKDPELTVLVDGKQTSSGAQRAAEDPSCLEVSGSTNSTKLFEKGLTKTFFFNLLSPARVAFLTFY